MENGCLTQTFVKQLLFGVPGKYMIYESCVIGYFFEVDLYIYICMIFVLYVIYRMYTHDIVSEWAEYDVECAKTLCRCNEICTFTTKKDMHLMELHGNCFVFQLQ